MNDTPRLKILIVDDERSNIIALTHILKSKYTVLAAIDGRTGLEAAKKSIPDLILLDVIMPDMTGFEVLAQLKSFELTQRIPVIIITGLDSTEDEKKGFFLGAVDYITKPFHDSIVEARVKTHLKISEYTHTIERLGMIDALTNIPNRRGFDNRLVNEWERAAREKTSISALMIDVDKFKNYNDTYGHPQGDSLLYAISEIFTQTLKRPADFVARWGGEEFVVLLPNTDLSGALEIAEQIRVNVERAVIPCADGTNTSITVSVGVNSEAPVTGRLSEDFVAGADKALYAAKNAGRNRVRSCV